MTTYSNLTGDLFGEPLTSSPADSPASHSVQLESEKAEPMNDISFRKCSELFQRSNRVGSSLKMFAACLVSNLDQYSPKLSHRWKAKATRSLRFVFLLQPSKPRTGEIDCGLWPEELTDEINLFIKTPAAFDHGTENMQPGTDGKGDGSLSQQMRYGTGQIGKFFLPTPQTADYKGAGTNDTGRDRLDYVIEKGRTKHRTDMIPTPHGFSQDGKVPQLAFEIFKAIEAADNDRSF